MALEEDIKYIGLNQSSYAKSEKKKSQEEQ